MANTAKLTERIYDDVLHAFDRRYRRKKLTNLCISVLIAALGVSSFLYGIRLESIRTIFRWMTVDGTVFTTLGALAFIVINLVEIWRNTEMTRKLVYYIRLSSAVAESVIFIVVTMVSVWMEPEAFMALVQGDRQGQDQRKE